MSAVKMLENFVGSRMREYSQRPCPRAQREPEQGGGDEPQAD
jgi:hypothetical protein